MRRKLRKIAVHVAVFCGLTALAYAGVYAYARKIYPPRPCTAQEVAAIHAYMERANTTRPSLEPVKFPNCYLQPFEKGAANDTVPVLMGLGVFIGFAQFLVVSAFGRWTRLLIAMRNSRRLLDGA